MSRVSQLDPTVGLGKTRRSCACVHSRARRLRHSRNVCEVGIALATFFVWKKRPNHWLTLPTSTKLLKSATAGTRLQRRWSERRAGGEVVRVETSRGNDCRGQGFREWNKSSGSQGVSETLCLRTLETCPRRRASPATNDRRGGQVGVAFYATSLVKRSA